jgi:membrane-associated phospholipid phosphatase
VSFPRACAAFFVVATFAPAPARAEPFKWPEKYPGIHAAEYVSIGVLLAANLYIELGMKLPREPGWTGPVLFDGGARTAFRLHRREDRDGLELFSDITLHVPQFQPVVIDAGIALAKGSFETAWNIEMMSAMGAGITGVLTRFPLYLIGRERPDTIECKQNPQYHNKCFAGANASFPSGHTSFAFTGAALSCAHHLQLKLWGNKAADIATCVAGMTLATTTAVTRLMMDRHWASDVLVGAGIGLLSGFGVAYGLHYGSWTWRTKEVHAAIVPATFGTALGGQLLGAF